MDLDVAGGASACTSAVLYLLFLIADDVPLSSLILHRGVVLQWAGTGASAASRQRPAQSQGDGNLLWAPVPGTGSPGEPWAGAQGGTWRCRWGRTCGHRSSVRPWGPAGRARGQRLRRGEGLRRGGRLGTPLPQARSALLQGPPRETLCSQ